MVTLELKLDELAKRAGVAPRTVRYYVQRGLLPAPPFRGRDTVYGAEHLARLVAIRAMQARYLPLDEIEAALGRCATLGEIEALGRGEAEGEARGSRDETPGSGDEARGEAQGEGEGWRRWELAPGLELHLRDSAGGEIEGLARERARVAADRRSRWQKK